MKYLALAFTAMFITPVFANCIWSETKAIPNLKTIVVSQCLADNKLRLNEELELVVNFELEDVSDCPECNFVWAKKSPNEETVFVYVENSKYQRNGWLIDIKNNRSLLFVDTSEPKGRHYIPEFIDDSRLRIRHAGMGYKNDEFYVLTNGKWRLE